MGRERTQARTVPTEAAKTAGRNKPVFNEVFGGASRTGL